MGRPVPARERLHGDHAAALEVHDRLVVDADLAALGGQLQRRGELLAMAHARVHLRLRWRAGACPRAWRCTWRRLRYGAARRGRHARDAERDADARVHRHLAAGDRERRLEGRDQALARPLRARRRRRGVRAPRTRPHRAGQGCPGAEALVQPPRHRDEQLVAGVMAEAVVDRLEVVEVEEQHCRIRRRRPRPSALRRARRTVPRLGSPVSVSWYACRCSCSLSSLRSLTDCSSRSFSSITAAWSRRSRRAAAARPECALASGMVADEHRPITPDSPRRGIEMARWRPRSRAGHAAGRRCRRPAPIFGPRRRPRRGSRPPAPRPARTAGAERLPSRPGRGDEHRLVAPREHRQPWQRRRRRGFEAPRAAQHSCILAGRPVRATHRLVQEAEMLQAPVLCSVRPDRDRARGKGQHEQDDGRSLGAKKLDRGDRDTGARHGACEEEEPDVGDPAAVGARTCGRCGLQAAPRLPRRRRRALRQPIPAPRTRR